MNRFEKFFGASTQFEIEGITLNVYPMTVEDSLLLSVSETDTKEQILERRAKLIKSCLREDGLTIDDIKKFRQDIFLAIIEKIMDVSEESAKPNEGALRRIKEQIAKQGLAKEGASANASTN